MGLHKKQEAICRKLNLRRDLCRNLWHQAAILEQMGLSDEASRMRAEGKAVQAELLHDLHLLPAQL